MFVRGEVVQQSGLGWAKEAGELQFFQGIPEFKAFLFSTF